MTVAIHSLALLGQPFDTSAWLHARLTVIDVAFSTMAALNSSGVGTWLRMSIPHCAVRSKRNAQTPSPYLTAFR